VYFYRIPFRHSVPGPDVAREFPQFAADKPQSEGFAFVALRINSVSQLIRERDNGLQASADMHN
jgi:hypothetical protein